jgi:hypothetical protein
MNIGGRYHRIRAFGPDDFTPPYIWDTRMQKLIPYQNGEWDRAGSVWFPAIRGGSAGMTHGQGYQNLWLYANDTTSMTANGLGLDSAYVYNTSGDAVGIRFVFPESKTLSTVYFFVQSFTGTAANVNDVEIELRNDIAGPKPGATLHASVAVDPGGTTGWKSGAVSFALTGGTYYWISLSDADGGVTDFATVRRTCTGIGGSPTTGTIMSGAPHRFAVSISSNGWSAITGQDNVVGTCVLVFSDNTVFGWPFTARAASANNTNDKGLYIDGTAAQVKIWGAASLSTLTSGSAFHVYSGSAAPNAPTATGTVQLIGNGAGATNLTGFMLPSVYTVTKETPHRFTFGFSVNSTVMARLQIGTGADANLKKAMRGGGGWYWTDGTGTTWTDATDEQPTMYIFAEDFFDQGGVSMSRVRLGM